MSNKALVVIDIQEDATGITARKPFLYKNSEELINNVNSIISDCHNKGINVVYIKHELEKNFINAVIMGNRFIKGTAGSKIDSRIKIVSDHVYSKNKGDAFTNPKLDSFLKKEEINEVIIVGLDASACVYRTSIGGVKNGYKVSVVKDAIVTMNMNKIPKLLDKYQRYGVKITSIQGLKDSV